MTHPLSEEMRKLAAIDVHQFTFGWGHAKQMQDCLRRAADALEAVPANVTICGLDRFMCA
jgi:hypothetical protein